MILKFQHNIPYMDIFPLAMNEMIFSLKCAIKLILRKRTGFRKLSRKQNPLGEEHNFRLFTGVFQLAILWREGRTDQS